MTAQDSYNGTEAIKGQTNQPTPEFVSAQMDGETRDAQPLAKGPIYSYREKRLSESSFVCKFLRSFFGQRG
jgi:hypothetical protein